MLYIYCKDFNEREASDRANSSPLASQYTLVKSTLDFIALHEILTATVTFLLQSPLLNTVTKWRYSNIVLYTTTSFGFRNQKHPFS